MSMSLRTMKADARGALKGIGWSEDVILKVIPLDPVDEPKVRTAQDKSPCYLCGFPADRHPWELYLGGRKRGRCPTEITTTFKEDGDS